MTTDVWPWASGLASGRPVQRSGGAKWPRPTSHAMILEIVAAVKCMAAKKAILAEGGPSVK